jgi:hypothetical protein
MWIVFCSSSDHSAIWAFEGLQRRGLAPLELVTTECLGVARFWEHRVGAGGAHLKIGLHDGRTLCSSQIRGALNRIAAPAPTLIQHAVESDREYATAEMQAFYLSWLNAVPGNVVNRPTPQGMSGAWHHISEWALIANRCGFNVPRYRQTDLDPMERGYASLAPYGAAVTSLVVLDGVGVFGPPVPPQTAASCQALAKAEKNAILGVNVYQDPAGDWLFAGATPTPWLPLGGDALLDGLVTLLTRSRKMGEDL